MARLYPPVTEEVLSAFCLDYSDSGQKAGAFININFSLNKAVASAEVAGIALRLRTISTNKYIITENINNSQVTGKSEGMALTYNLEDGLCTFSITVDNNPEVIEALKVGQFYKIQLAFIGLTGTIGYWSTVATIKCVARPSVTIANYDPNDANIFTSEILGEYVQDTSTGDSSEKVYTYRFQLFDNQNNLLDDTGIKLHNSSYDVSSNSSTDEYYCYQELNEGESYYLIYSITTINGLSVSSPRYQIIPVESIDPEDDITLVVSNGLDNNINSSILNKQSLEWYPWEEGLIKIYPDLNEHIQNNIEKRVTGNFVVLRSSSKDNFHTWQEVKRFRLNNEFPYEKIFYDYTTEQGISYRYAIQQFNRQQFYSKKVYSYKRNPTDQSILYKDSLPIYNDIIADFEDMFLYDGKRQLKIRFNPQVSSFKNDLQEQKIDTIGSKHPFIFRNGNVCYKEFPIGGLISFQIDNAELFMTDEDYAQMNLSRFEPNNDIRNKNEYIDYKELNESELFDAINNSIELYQYVKEQRDSLEISGHENDIANNTFLSQEEKNLLLKNNKTQLVNYSYYRQIGNASEALNLFNQGIKIYKKIQATSKNNFIDYSSDTPYNKLDLTSENIMSERYFKLLVLDWLTDGKPKLFRSPTEGNYIVRLLNVNLTPKTELGRMIHEFTCTAYEIADFNYQSLRDLGLLTIEDSTEIERQWFSRDINTILDERNKGINGYYTLNVENKEIIGFQATGFAPGDKIQIMTKDASLPLDITIGTTGSYIYDEGKIILSISILPMNNTGDFSRNVLLATQGYATQKFDTISSISTHTQMGEQLVGPVDNFLQKTTVGTGLYYTSPNVNLIPDEGEKLRVSEILHFHAKRREIIPIFYNNKIGLQYTANANNLPKFSLTPFGQGYIKYKSIIPSSQIEWINNGLGNLTEEELVKERDIKNLTDFVISKCNKDIFCLFEVYAPEKNENTNKTEWVPYSSFNWSPTSHDWYTTVYGIYDPWLYEQQSLKMDENAQKTYQYCMGWWPRKSYNNSIYYPKTDYGIYDPTITFHYENQDVELSLKDKNEITLTNIRVPESITIGNGAVVEPIYRLQCIDYTIENENAELKQLKNNYLTIKEEALSNIVKYRRANSSKLLGNMLYEKYNIILKQLQDYEDYKNIIGQLTDLAREQQIRTLQDYFKNENNLIKNMLLQLQMVDFDLREELGLPYENDSTIQIYPQEESGLINIGKTSYEDFFTSSENFIIDENNNIIPQINDKDSIQNVDAEKTRVINLINHIQNSNNYNFFNIIENLKLNLQPKIDEASNLLDELTNKSYVSQYLDYLDDKIKKLFFEEEIKLNILDILDISESEHNNLFNYKLIYKKYNNIENLQNTSIMDPLWSEYFHFDKSEDDSLSLLSLSLQQEENTTTFKYYINNLQQYEDGSIEDSCLLKNSNLISTIKEKLNDVNKYIISTDGTESDPITSYETVYFPVKYQYGQPLYRDNNLKLGDIIIQQENNIENYSIQQPANDLEKLIDNLYLSNPDISIEEVLTNITESSLFNGLPDALKKQLGYSKINEEDNTLSWDMENGYIFTYLKYYRQAYQQVKACLLYYNNHIDTLSTEQKNIINMTINTILNETEKDKDNNYRTFNNESYSDIFSFLNEWNTAFDDIQNSPNYQENYNELIKSINDFNTIITYKKSLIKQIKEYQDRYMETLTSYSSSDNIKEVLWEEREIYLSAQNHLNDIQEMFSLQLKNYQKNVLLEGYFDFLISYINSHKESNTTDKNKYLQLLEEASAMASATIDENNNPYKQNLLVQQAWKQFLDALSKTYQIEIKEKFG